MKKHLDLSTRKKNPTQYLHLRSFAKFGKGLPRTTRLLKMDNKTQKSFSNWLFKINFYRAATKPIFSAQDDVNLQHMSLAIIISACPSSRRLRHENGSERRSWSRRSLTRERKSTWWIAWCPTKSRWLKITEKVSFNIVSEARFVYFLTGQKFIKNAKNSPFRRVFENLKFAVK